MSKYSLTLVGNNQASPMFKGAAADAGDLTAALRQQQQAAKALDRSHAKLGKFENLREGMAASRAELAKTHTKMRGLAAQQDEARVSVAKLAAEKSAAARQVKRLSDQIAKAGAPTDAMVAKFKAAKSHASNLGDQLAIERARVKSLGDEFNAAKSDAQGLKTTFDKQLRSANKLGHELRDAGVDTDKLSDEQKRLARASESATSSIDAQKDSLTKLGAARAAASRADKRLDKAKSQVLPVVAAAAAITLPVMRAVTMQSAMADVAKVTDFEGDEQSKFQSKIQRLATEVNIAPEDLTQIAAAAGQSGVKKEELAGFTGSAARMGVAFDMAAADAGKTMAAWRAGMNLNQLQAEQLADAVNHVSNSINAEAKDISGVLKRQGAVATSSGLRADQAASLAGALLSGGASEEVAATTMKNLLGALTKGDAATTSQKDGLSSLGLSTSALAGDMQRDAVGTIQRVFDALSDAPLEEQSALISQIFGEESKGGIMPLLKNQTLLRKSFGLTADKSKYLGSALEEYNNRKDVVEHRLGSAWRAIDRLGISLGSQLLPIIGPVADGVANAANYLADLADAYPGYAAAVSGGAAAITAAAAAYVGYKVVAGQFAVWRNAKNVLAAQKQAKLAAKTGQTAAQASLAARALDRLNQSLRRTAGAGYGGGYAGDAPDGDGKSDKRKKGGAGRGSRMGRRGRIGRLLGRGFEAVKGFAGSRTGKVLGAGASTAALMGVSSAANAGDLDAAADVVGGAADLASSVGGMTAKLLRPLNLVLQGTNLVSAARSGDAVEIGGAVGDIGGGTAGALAGGAAGAAIGLVVPVIGTVIGGAIGAAIGGFAGGEGGRWLGEQTASLLGKGDALQKAEQQASTRQIAQTQQVHFAPHISIAPSPNADSETVASMVMEKLQQMFDQSVTPMAQPTLQGRIDDSMEIS